MKNALLVLVSVALCAVMLLGCSGSSTTAPTGASSAAAEKVFSDVSIIFFPGGSEGDSFATVVYNGAARAQAELGCKVDYMWSGWSPDRMISQLRDAIAMKPDGICIMGHPGDTAFEPLVAQARQAGIIVTSQNSPLPVNEAKYKTEGFGYVGAGQITAGEMLGTAAIQRAGVRAGDTAIVWGLLGQAGRGERTQGIINACKAANLNVAYYEISDAVNADASQGTSVFAGFVAANPNAKLIFTDHGALTSTVGTYMRAAGKNPGDIYCAGFDLSAASVEAINSGYLGCILDQQPWLQGFLPIVQICLTVKYGFSGLHIDTGASIIDKSNINEIAPLAQKGIR
jgi:simple sugar transport system substrate-binding protein